MMVPFKIPEVHGGLSEGDGTLLLTDDYLEIRVTVSILGMIDQRPIRIKLARTAIRDIRYEQTYWGDKIILRPYNPRVFDELPGKHAGEIVLKIKKKFRQDGIALVQETLLWLDEEDGESDEL